MATTAAPAGPRKTISIHDYPEHLNPFHEDDNHNKIRFWTIGRKLNRSNSITFSGLKELKNSWALRSFMKKGKRGQQASSQEKNFTNHVNGESSPIVFRRALQYTSASSATGTRSTVSSPERADRYVYGGSVTPLPRSRFQERLRSPSQHEVNSLSVTPRMAHSDVTGSRLSVESTNPFDEAPVPPVRASRRKKKRAPPPPPESADVSISSVNSELHISESEEKKTKVDAELDKEVVNTNIELKIVEDDDVKSKATKATTPVRDVNTNDQKVIEDTSNEEQIGKETKKDVETKTCKISNADSEDNILDKVSFPKIDITKYRRNSSLNEDDIRLRRGNLEDFHQISGKRSKSLTNNLLDSNHVTYDIDFNENRTVKDPNGNGEPQKVICKLYHETSRKQSIDNSVSSTEKEFIEIDKATRELERQINKLNSALSDDDNILQGAQLSVSEIRRKFDNPSSPNPIPKPRRSHYGGSTSPVNGD